MPETTGATRSLIHSLIWLRMFGATESEPMCAPPIVYRVTPSPGLVERDCGAAWLTSAGWELAERMIAAADDQLVLFRREQAGTLSDEDAEKRRVA